MAGQERGRDAILLCPFIDCVLTLALSNLSALPEGHSTENFSFLKNSKDWLGGYDFILQFTQRIF